LAPARRATVAPFNFRLAAPEIARLLEDSGARILFVSADVVDLAGQAVASVASKPRMIARSASTARATNEATRGLKGRRWTTLASTRTLRTT
jgi:acyl-CoA synthetase (AMP-forming)/AMP-acid ligase II